MQDLIAPAQRDTLFKRRNSNSKMIKEKQIDLIPEELEPKKINLSKDDNQVSATSSGTEESSQSIEETDFDDDD